MRNTLTYEPIKALYVILVITTFLQSCIKHNDSTPGNTGTKSSTLLPASTGWQTVSTIPFMQPAAGLPGSYAITPYDITYNNGQLALLYSEDYKLSGVDGHNIFKLKLTNGRVDAKNTAVQLNYGRFQNAKPVYHFIPGSFTTVSAQFDNNDCYIFDGVTGIIGSANFGNAQPIYTMHYYEDSSILMGLIDSKTISAAWHYTYPQIRNFTYVTNEWSSDTTFWLHSTAFKLSDKKLYDLVLSTKGNRMYFSVIRNKQPIPVSGKPNFDIICRNIVPGLDAAKQYVLLATDIHDDMETVLLGEMVDDGNSYLTKLHCFRWKKGSSTLEKLYSDISINREISDAMLFSGVNTSQANEIRFLPDGTAYVLWQNLSAQGLTGPTTALYTINSAGVKEHGRIDNKIIGDQMNGQFLLRCCRYFNGAFYAVISPASEYYFDHTKPEFRAELVKLTL